MNDEQTKVASLKTKVNLSSEDIKFVNAHQSNNDMTLKSRTCYGGHHVIVPVFDDTGENADRDLAKNSIQLIGNRGVKFYIWEWNHTIWQTSDSVKHKKNLFNKTNENVALIIHSSGAIEMVHDTHK